MSTSTSDATFDRDVLGSEVPVLVDFWGEKYPPCKLVAPIVEGVRKKVMGQAKVYELNVDENPLTVARFGITGVPTVALFSGGKFKREFTGIRPAGVYLNALARVG